MRRASARVRDYLDVMEGLRKKVPQGVLDFVKQVWINIVPDIQGVHTVMARSCRLHKYLMPGTRALVKCGAFPDCCNQATPSDTVYEVATQTSYIVWLIENTNERAAYQI